MPPSWWFAWAAVAIDPAISDPASASAANFKRILVSPLAGNLTGHDAKAIVLRMGGPFVPPTRKASLRSLPPKFAP
ncbi:hypothetical protein GCM10009127_03830 [Alteraurantiacibacter aestuarii]